MLWTNTKIIACTAGVILFGLARYPLVNGATNPPPKIPVILWFDTEDYLLPASDDAAQRLAEILTAKGVRATFNIVVEKARVLEQRGRLDVIAALKKHDVAYHANLHSVHPTPSEYLADCGFLDGVAEFIRREGGGAADVRRIFGVSTMACYGQPGSSWAPQAIAGLKTIGVEVHGTPCYVDEGTHVGLNGQPFWYCGALMVYHMAPNYTRMELHDPGKVEPGKQEVKSIADRLRQTSRGGLISIFYHPCEWVHQEFWDGVNFRRGANPPREQWRPPPQRPAAETEQAFRRFADYIDYILSLPDVRFVTASDLPALYPDQTRSPGATAADLRALAERLAANDSKGIDYCVLGNKAFSAADQFELLAMAVRNLALDQPAVFPQVATGMLGPDSAPGDTVVLNEPVSWPAFRDAVRDVCDYLQTQHRVPPRVYIGAKAVPPADFLAGLASAWLGRQHGTWPPPNGVRLGSGVALLAERCIAQDTSDLFGGWVIHPEGFRAPKILAVARLQAWTIKPALPQ